MKLEKNKTYILSRTDSIGDVILTLPMAGVIKETYPGCRIIFLGRAYTKPLVDLSIHVDGFLDWSEIENLPRDRQVEIFKSVGADNIIHVFPRKAIAEVAKKAGIRERIGTRNRIYHWWTCNRLSWMTRRKSDLHEAQLNLRLLRMLDIRRDFSLDQISSYYGFRNIPQPTGTVLQAIDPTKKNLILHLKSKGSAREWGLDNFSRLIGLLSSEDFHIMITGTDEEGAMIRQSGFFDRHTGLADLTGKLTLEELISLIGLSDALVAASTGPLHIAAALGIVAIGIYPPMHPIHPGRWAPLGKKASYLVLDKTCSDCRKSQDCECMRNIPPEAVYERLISLTKNP